MHTRSLPAIFSAGINRFAQQEESMTRGPAPRSAIEAAEKIAWSRGFVTLCQRKRGSVCDFVIHSAEYTAVVLIARSRRLHGSNAEMEAQCAEQIARLRLVPQGLYRSLELWACSPYGGIRFFRISGNGLVELRKDGKSLDDTSTT
jgi:hypothetical protein